MSTTTPQRHITLHLGPDKFEDPVLRIWSEDVNWRIDFAWKSRYTAAYSVLVDKRDAEFKLEELSNG